MPAWIWEAGEVARAVAARDAAAVLAYLWREVGLSRRDLAQLCDVDPSTVTRAVNGQGGLSNPRRAAEVLERLGAPQSRHPVAPAPEPSGLQELLGDHASDQTIARLEHHVTELATAYVSQHHTQLTGPLHQAREHALDLLRRGTRPRHTRDLLVLLGTVELLLGYAAHDAGQSATARAHLADADTCATHAEHRSLLSWVAGTRALVADRHSTSEATELATRAQALTHGPHSWVRVSAITARAAARRGDAPAAQAGLEHLLTASPNALSADPDSEDLSVRHGGLFVFSPAKASYYAGATLALLGDADGALAYASTAVQTYEAGPASHRSYGDLTLAQVDVITAHLMRGDPAGTHEAITHLERIAQSSPGHIHQLQQALRTCRDVVANSPLSSVEKRQLTRALNRVGVRWHT
ncbi:hypothetical protein [Nocardiopsis kunsanensis]|uniref:hypothetical protein n=1 Tax=Nocardiopsis kunsanensis TaxID=141693 RepID=UPI000367684E|nr:hypothetical protein [Nocardiopsis kunsanensis]